MKKTVLLLTAVVGASSAHASFIYGLAQQGGIWKIDTSTGNSTLVASTLVVNRQGGTNGLAHDGAGTFYYSSGTTFYKNSGTEQAVTVAGFNGSNANATFHGGKYVYASAANQVKQIDLGALTIAASAVAGLNTGYGDIASDLSGKVWAQTGSKMQTFDLGNLSGGATTLSSSNTGTLQLGFDENWKLFGINYADGKIYAIDTATGIRTFTGGIANNGGSLLKINDAASAVPEPGTMVALAAGLAAVARRRKASK